MIRSTPLIGRLADKLAPEHFEYVRHHPSADGGIEHHQDVIAGDGDIAFNMPFRAFGFQYVETSGRGSLACPAHGKFHDHDRHAEDDKKDQIDDDKGGAAVFSRDVRKAPHVSQADGASCGNEDEAEAGSKTFSFFHKKVPLTENDLFRAPRAVGKCARRFVFLRAV